MKKCTGHNIREWGFDSIFDVKCSNCECLVEFFKDEITRNCPQCQKAVLNDRKDYGCNLFCSSSSSHSRSRCSNFRRSKARFYGRY